MERIRLHKFIASAGVCSRRKAEQLIAEGYVSVNGEIVTAQGTSVTLDDDVRIEEKRIRPERHVTVLMNKPVGVVTTLSDPQGRGTVAKYLPDMGVRLKPVGRLDKETSGVLLFTNDGELAALLTHPRHQIEKEYVATVKGFIEEKSLDKLRKGVRIMLEEGRIHKTSPCRVELVSLNRRDETSVVRITLREGKKRQVREMFAAVGHSVVSLDRVRFGHLTARGLARGQCKTLGQKDLERLRQSAAS